MILLCTAVFSAEDGNQPKYLHISTNPSGTDAYLHEVHPNFASNPDYRLPAFIKVPAGESNVLVTLFHPEYADTTINVQLSEKDTSFLIVALRPAYDDDFIEGQRSDIAHRNRRNFGKGLLLTSAIPLIAAGISALVASYDIQKANDKKDAIENSVIQNEAKISKDLKDFNHYRNRAKSAKQIMTGSLIASGIILSAGIILSF